MLTSFLDEMEKIAGYRRLMRITDSINRKNAKFVAHDLPKMFPKRAPSMKQVEKAWAGQAEKTKDLTDAVISAGNKYGRRMEKVSSIGHAVELAGLGILAKPSIDHLRGKKVNEKSMARHEVAGLGVLAAPYAAHFAQKGMKALSKVKRAAAAPLGQLTGRAAHIVQNGAKAAVKPLAEVAKKKPQFTMADLRAAQAKMGIKPPPGIR